jgi:hypothetical protein
MNTILLLKKFSWFFFGVLSLSILWSCGSSRRTVGIEEGWEVLAEEKVNFVKDKDEIEVRSRNMFTAIRFTVEDRDIRINDLKVTFQNGDKLEPAIDEVIAADQSSRVIDLALEGRYIDRIEFKYRTTGNLLKGRANVLIIGKRYNPGY